MSWVGVVLTIRVPIILDDVAMIGLGPERKLGIVV